MSRKQQPRRNKKEDGPVTLKDTLGTDLLEKLKQTKNQLEQQEEKKKQEELKRRQEERKRAEKNKSFEELLNESDLDWKKYK